MTEVLDLPQIDPRIAQRRTDVAREQWRRRRRQIIGVAAVAGCIGAAVGGLYSPLMAVRHIRISTPQAVTAAQVESYTGLTHHELMIKVATGVIQERLDAVPDLGGARVTRRWPGTVTISVRTRTAVAVVSRGSAGGWALVDVTGRILADTATRPQGMPEITGDGLPPAPGGWISGSLGPAVLPGGTPTSEVQMGAPSDSPAVPSQAAAALVAVQALPAAVRAEVTSVTAGAATPLSLVVEPLDAPSGSIQVLLGDGSQLADKLTSLVTLLDQADLSGVVSINLTVPDRPATLTAR